MEIPAKQSHHFVKQDAERNHLTNYNVKIRMVETTLTILWFNSIQSELNSVIG